MKNASQRFDRFRLAKNDFRKAAAAAAVEIERHIAQLGGRRRRSTRARQIRPAKVGPPRAVRRQSFHLISIHSAILMPPCEGGYGGVKSCRRRIASRLSVLLQNTSDRRDAYPTPHALLRPRLFRRSRYFGHLGWLQDEGYEVHAVYVDLGQPCEDRQAILKKAKDCGAEVGPDRRCPGGAVPRLRLSGAAVAGQVRRRLSAGHVDRPAADLQGLLAGGPRSRGRRLRPRRDRQGERPVPLSAGGRGARIRRCKIIAPWRMEKFRQQFPGRTRDDRLLRAEEHSGQGVGRQAVQLATKTACTSATRRASWKT